MNTRKYIPLSTLCTHYRVEMSFFDNLGEIGLLDIESVEESPAIPAETVGEVEKIIRLHQELNLNLEAIDVVFNLLHRVGTLQSELQSVRSRLRIYEG